jgi:hypothetical protein
MAIVCVATYYAVVAGGELALQTASHHLAQLLLKRCYVDVFKHFVAESEHQQCGGCVSAYAALHHIE